MTPSRRIVRDLCLILLGAFLHTVAFPPYEWTGVGWLALAPLFFVLREISPKRAFLAGFLYAVLWCVGIGYWVYLTVMTHFPLPFPFDYLFVLGSYSIFAGLPTGIVTALCSMLMRQRNSLWCWAGIPALWATGEFLRSDLFVGFSWGVIGYAPYRQLPLIQIADITGVYGLSFLMALSGYVIAEAAACGLRRWRKEKECSPFPWSALGTLVTGIGVVWVYGLLCLSHYQNLPSPSLTVALVQGEVPSERRWQRPYYARTLMKYISVSRQGINGTRPDLVVWPEFALGFYLDQEALLRSQLGAFTQRMYAPLLVGAPRMGPAEMGAPSYNAAYLIAPGGEILDVYDKIRLMLFTEYRPATLPVVLRHAEKAPSLFTAGTRATVFSLPQASFGVVICYEATFPSLARHLVRDGAQFLVNISNETWLAVDYAALAQHFALTVFRAVENRRYFARSATAGLSGFVDPVGRPYQVSIEEDQALMGKIAPRCELSVYTQYGDWFAWTCTGFGVFALLRAWRSRPNRELP